MKYTLLSICLLFTLKLSAQNNTKKISRPKLVVGIIVDQMREDYLYRFYDKYSEGGFKKLMNDGFNCRNNQYHYASTVTGPGHAHTYNGSSPGISGIVGNEWFDKNSEKITYVVSDSTVATVGDGSATAGKMSPRNMIVTTICDQMRIASQFKSKTIGIAIKDRGAILPAGHTGDAYWFDAIKGNWITSTFYKTTLPEWVNTFNNLKLPEKYISQTWNTLLPIDQYTETEADDQPYENNISGETKAVFPHKVIASSIATTYFGNELTTKFALAALESENLGKDNFCDFLAISYSSPDYAGHAFGPQSKEIEDIYLRLDKNIAEMLANLDLKVGKGNYTVFLTADHGVAEIPGFLRKNKIPAGLLVGSELSIKAERILSAKFGEGKYIKSNDNYQMYLNMPTLVSKKISVSDIVSVLRATMPLEEGILDIINLFDGNFNGIAAPLQAKLQGLYYPKRSGEIMVIVEPAWFGGLTKGTTHGTIWSYDTHVPLLFYGSGINKGSTFAPTYMADIAPTLAGLLSILEPNGNIGKPIIEVLKIKITN
jgi:predicted AlkP superfamily pyrophosphatase or phosphodiesterase